MLQKGRSASKAILSTYAEQIFLEPDDCIVAMDYLMEKEALVIGTSSGCLLLHIIELKTTEVVGRVEGGVKSISASPDGALLAVTAGLGQLLVMTHDWEVLYETELDPQLSEVCYCFILSGSFNFIEMQNIGLVQVVAFAFMCMLVCAVKVIAFGFLCMLVPPLNLMTAKILCN